MKFFFLLVCCSVIQAYSLINQQGSKGIFKSNSPTLDSTNFQKNLKSDSKIDTWSKTWTQILENLNLASKYKNTLKNSRFNARQGKTEAVLVTRSPNKTNRSGQIFGSMA